MKTKRLKRLHRRRKSLIVTAIPNSSKQSYIFPFPLHLIIYSRKSRILVYRALQWP